MSPDSRLCRLGPDRRLCRLSRIRLSWVPSWLLFPGPDPAATRRGRAGRPHQTWQIDAAELIPLRDRRLVCWLRIVDEATGAVLKTAVFPPRTLDPGRSPGHAGGPAGGVHALGPPRAVA